MAPFSRMIALILMCLCGCVSYSTANQSDFHNYLSRVKVLSAGGLYHKYSSACVCIDNEVIVGNGGMEPATGLNVVAFRGNKVVLKQTFNPGISPTDAEELTKAIGRMPVNTCVIICSRGDTVGAIANYTAVITMPGAPADLKAKALFDRSTAKKKAGDTTGAIADIKAVIEIPGAVTELKAKAMKYREELDDG